MRTDECALNAVSEAGRRYIRGGLVTAGEATVALLHTQLAVRIVGGLRVARGLALAELRLGCCADRDAWLLVLAGEFLLAVAGPDLHCDQEAGKHGEAGRDQEGEPVARYQGAGRVLRARCGDGSEHRESGRGASLLAGGEQRAGQALITALDAAGDGDRRADWASCTGHVWDARNRRPQLRHLPPLRP